MEQAFINATQNPLAQQDISLLASQTFHNLAVGFEPVGMGPSRGPRLTERRAPLGEFGAYVVPRAGLGGGQIEEEVQEMPSTRNDLVSPAVSPRSDGVYSQGLLKRAGIQPRPFRMNEAPADMISTAGLSAPPMQQVDSDGVPLQGMQIDDPEPPVKPRGPAFRDQTPPAMQALPPPTRVRPAPRTVRIEGPTQATLVPASRVATPETKVTFEMEGWGTFEAVYHEVIKNECMLVLVWDNNFKGGMHFTPPASDRLLAVKVDGSDKVYFVNSTGTKFTHGQYEYCLLIIDQEQVES